MSETMTIKELAEVAGCYVRTVNSTIKKHFPELIQHGKKTKLTKSQAETIMALLPKRNSVNGSAKNSTLENRLDRLEAGLERLVNIVTLLASHQIAEKKEQVSLPPINYRSELNSIIRVYAVKNEINFNVAWHKFYNRALYRIRKNFELCASNEGKHPLDWAEENGYIEQLYQLAKEEF